MSNDRSSSRTQAHLLISSQSSHMVPVASYVTTRVAIEPMALETRPRPSSTQRQVWLGLLWGPEGTTEGPGSASSEPLLPS